jgi:peptidoglycan hydrolase-like protein with peptidoglycan-binding domain
MAVAFVQTTGKRWRTPRTESGMAGEPTLRERSTGNWVEHLQSTLEARGYDPGPVDGDFGPRTEAAVKEYQEAHGLTADGIVGPLTWASLNEGDEPEDEDVWIEVEECTLDEDESVSLDQLVAAGWDSSDIDETVA